jgi:DNA-binding IclR family transcriptional regulator
VIDPGDFLAEAKAARRRGVCIITGLVDNYATCIAAPVSDHSGRCIACICFIVSSSLGRARMRELSAMLVEAGRSLSAVPDIDVG